MSRTRALVLAIIALLLYAPAPAAQETKLTNAVYILPLACAPGAKDADLFAGVGLQNLLENMLVADGGLQENWALWRYPDLFPKVDDLTAYVSGQAPEPEKVAALAPRWLARGRLLASGRLSVEIEDRQERKRVTRELPLDFPKLTGFRGSFLDALREGGVPIQGSQRRKMLWREDLSPRALALGGRGYVR